MTDYNELYNKTVEFQGKTYYYDPDYDCFYPRYDRTDLNHWDRYSPIYVAIALGLLVWATS